MIAPTWENVVGRIMHHFWLSEEARAGELSTELRARRLLLALARSQRWPKLELQRQPNHRYIIRPLRLDWEYFASTVSPAMVVYAIVALWPGALIRSFPKPRERSRYGAAGITTALSSAVPLRIGAEIALVHEAARKWPTNPHEVLQSHDTMIGSQRLAIGHNTDLMTGRRPDAMRRQNR